MSEKPIFDEAWRWNGWTTTHEEVTDGAVDSEGNIVLVGSQGYWSLKKNVDDDTFTDGYSGDFAAVKLDAAGEILWTSIISSAGSSADMWFAVDTDSNNDVIVGGRTEGYWSSSNPDNIPHPAIVKLDGGTGEEVWRYQEIPPDSTSYPSTDPAVGSVSGATVDGDDNAFLVGQVYGSLVEGEEDPWVSDYVVIKLNGTDGSEIWTVQGGDSSSLDHLHCVEADSSGDVVAAGIGGDGDSISLVVMKFSGATGSILWEYSPATLFTHDVAHAIDVDIQGNVYVAGGFETETLQVGNTNFIPFDVLPCALETLRGLCHRTNRS